MGKGHSKAGVALRGAPSLSFETMLRRAGAITPRVRATARARAPPQARNHRPVGHGKQAWVRTVSS
jgi:hypothetical protein